MSILNHIKEKVAALWALALLLLLIASCGGGGGGVGGGLIPGLMTMNTHAVLSGGEVQLTVSGGLAPYSFSIYRSLGGVTTAPYAGVTIDNSGTIKVPDIGEDIDYLIIKVVDDMGRIQYFRVPVLGKPNSWFSADKLAGTNTVGSYVSGMPDRSGNDNNAVLDAGDADCLSGKCPQLISRDPALNNMPTLYFDGNNDYMKFANLLTDDMTVALVFRSGAGSGLSTSTNYQSVAPIIQGDFFGAGLTAKGVTTPPDPTGRLVAGTNAGALLSYSSSHNNYDNNQGHIVLIARDNGGVTRFYINGVGQTSDANTSGNSLAGGDIFLGANTTGNKFFLGSVPEVLVYDRNLGGTTPDDQADRLTLTRYLKERYHVYLPDVSNPTVSFTLQDPADGAYTTSTSASFEYTYESSGWADIEKVECRLDSGAWFNCRNPDIFANSHAWSFTNLPDGAHTFTVKVTDADEKFAEATSGWASDNTAPVCTITGNNHGDDLSDGWGEFASYTIYFKCLDVSPFAAANPECSINGGTSWYECDVAGNPDGSVEGSDDLETTTFVTNNSASFMVRASDSVGNGPGAAATLSWQIDREDPICSFTAPPSGWRTTNSEDLIFSCSDQAPGVLPAGYRVQCSFDGGAYQNCDSNSGHHLGSLAEGAHTLSIKVADQAGRESAIVTASWSTDTMKPVCTFTSIPGTYGGENPQPVRFTCTDSAGAVPTPSCSYDGTFADGITCGALTASPPERLQEVPSASEGITYHFYVKAVDQVGNVSDVIHTQWITDLTDPVCSITSAPTINPPLEFAAATIEFTCSDSGGAMPMGTATCSLDGATAVACDNFTGGTGIRNGSESVSVPGGDHSLVIVGIDAAGRSAAPLTANWRTDLTIPICTIDASNIGDSYGDTTTVIFPISCSDELAFDNPAPQKPQCTFDDITSGTSNLYSGDCDSAAAVYAGTGPYTVSQNFDTTDGLGTLVEGNTYRLKVNVTDSSGKTMTTPPTVTWTVDLTPPSCTITGGPSGFYASDSGNVTFSCSDDAAGMGSFTCDLAGPTPYNGPCSSSVGHSFSGVADGAYTLTVTGYDRAGNPSAPVTRNWTVDATTPVISITNTTRVSDTSRRLNYSITETNLAAGSPECQYSVDGGAATGWIPCDSATAHVVDAADGVGSGVTFMYMIKATDDAGNSVTETYTDEILRGARTVAECDALNSGGVRAATPTFFQGGGEAGENNLCILVDLSGSGVTCAGVGWTFAGFSATTAQSNGDYGLPNGIETSDARSHITPITNCNSSAWPTTCTTTDHTWGAVGSEAETCQYDDDRVTQWNWQSYGNPAGFISLLSGNVVSTETTCPSSIEFSEGLLPGIDDDCSGDGGATGTPVPEGTHMSCSTIEDVSPCCLKRCAPQCTGENVVTVSARVTQTSCK